MNPERDPEEVPKEPPKDTCPYCNATGYESRNSNYKGCVYCRGVTEMHTEMTHLGMRLLSRGISYRKYDENLNPGPWIEEENDE